MKRITNEMRRYMGNGHCPHCDVVILNTVYNVLNDNLGLNSGGSGLTFFERLRLAPDWAMVTFAHPNTFTCVRCRETWNIRTDAPFTLTSAQLGILGIAPSTSTLASFASSATAPPTLTPAQFRFTGIAPSTSHEEVVARQERKVMRNHSSATLTRTEEFSWSRERTVTVEDRKATIKGSKGELTIAGLAALGGTLTTELRNMYAVTTQEQLVRTTSVSAQLQPYSAIEIELEWRLVRELGVGRFAGSAGAQLEMPFAVDINLTVEAHTRDAHDPEH